MRAVSRRSGGRSPDPERRRNDGARADRRRPCRSGRRRVPGDREDRDDRSRASTTSTASPTLWSTAEPRLTGTRNTATRCRHSMKGLADLLRAPGARRRGVRGRRLRRRRWDAPSRCKRDHYYGTKWPFIGNRQPEQRYRSCSRRFRCRPRTCREVEGPEPGSVAVLEEERPRREGRRGYGHDQRRARTMRGRAAIEWGNAGHGPFNSIAARALRQRLGWLRVCRRLARLRSPSACVPLRSSASARAARRDQLRGRASLLGRDGARLHELVDQAVARAPPRAS